MTHLNPDPMKPLNLLPIRAYCPSCHHQITVYRDTDSGEFGLLPHQDAHDLYLCRDSDRMVNVSAEVC